MVKFLNTTQARGAVTVSAVIPTKWVSFWKSIAVTFSSVKETSTSGGVRAATIARPRGGIMAFFRFRMFSCVAGTISSSFIRLLL